jgi:monovalent cation:H+ antiporter-2, CPA2 family
LHASAELLTYSDMLIFLAIAGVVAPLFFRIHVSPVLGYLIAGALLGPFGLGRFAVRLPWLELITISNVGAVERIAGFGVVALTFTIGLELSFERLKSLRKLVFGLGLAQMVACAALIGCVAALVGAPPTAAIILGAALSLSSTAIVVPVLAEYKLMNAQVGRLSFSILLFQDLAVAPLLILVAVLSGGKGGCVFTELAVTLASAAAAVAIVIGLGRLVLRPLFHSVALTRNAESFMAACLLVAFGSAFIAWESGLSMALGAFLAGLLLAETEFRREVEVTIEPFKGLLLGLYFVSIGAQLDLALAFNRPLAVFEAVVAFMGLKMVATFVLARVFGAAAAPARDAAVVLASGGEFAFVLLSAIFAAAISMFVLPLLGRFVASSAAKRRRAATPAEALVEPPEDVDNHVIIVGFGRVGALIGDMLDVHKIPFIGVDADARIVSNARRDNRPVYFGDATRAEFLRVCGIETARALVVTLNMPKSNEDVVEIARGLRPDMTIVARARDAEHASMLYRLGVTDAVPETIEASLQLSEAVLVDLGVPMGYVIASIHEKRDEFRQRLIASGAPDRRKAKKPTSPSG